MPQMAPLNWLTLMIMFISILILFNIMNYYSTSYSANLKKSKKEKKMINWKW
uniref:ATP synthase complex subunit 8 n=1 Tax=Tenebrio molitor TaxID=7067 RepID=A0A075C9Y8_TENMO|nr:ATP synthase F0 subunit 8 [Tenebrio molitor]AGX28412.1 ATP synthase F0 subunit 8 [Tenebrio molitor]AKR06300.1 ATP synthase F0 subunit 8 [Tenebrio molitor]QDG00990.1 ATP synthase F0 subunit 8 [Tenebrio molitor]QDG01003.1 ATP synthase F0 subunit 8 [Tenebrio molitor]QDG01016.1 ATP synthase F0 subunit 8 [Tenebrio molitor]